MRNCSGPASLVEAVDLLRRGELVAIPTETVYGLAANAWDAQAVRKIFAVKGRPAHNPLIVHIASADQFDRVARLPANGGLRERFEAACDLWPGPLTLVLPKADRIPDIVTAGGPTVAIRIPDHPLALDLLRRCPFPLAAPSANRSNYISPTTAQHCRDGLGADVAMVLDGGPCAGGVESTIVNLAADPPQILRPGLISAEQLSQRLRCPVKLAAATPAGHPHAEKPLAAPGMLPVHYAPHTPLRLLQAGEPPTELRPAGRIAFAPLDATAQAPYAVVRVLSSTGNLHEVARGLFAALRELDDAGLAAIDCDGCPAEGVGAAIMDRLRRAATRR